MKTRSFLSMYRFLFFVVLFIGFFVTLGKPCHAKHTVYVPDLLKPWVDWVLHDHENLSCVPRFDNPDVLYCSWPSSVRLTLTKKGGAFTQHFRVESVTRVQLPGSSDQWPEDVRVNGEPCVVLGKNGVPVIELNPGVFKITGGFTWANLPESLSVPKESAMVSLVVDKEKVEFPGLDSSGRLWLKRRPSEEKNENKLKIESFRLLEDSIPFRMHLLLTLEVSGAVREIKLGPLYNTENFIPLSLESALPARLERDGILRIRLRPGSYTIRLGMRHTGPLSELSFQPYADNLMPEQEIWMFKRYPDYRIVEVRGGSAIDSSRTSAPEAWQKYPAYLMGRGETMVFDEIKRGDPEPAPDQLRLNRDLWLRFDGSGFTVRDRIKGKKNTNWRLEIDPSITPGRVTIDGKEQLITRLNGSGRAGVEVRNGILNLTAENTYTGNISKLPATGWDHDFETVKGRLFLPPGWKLIHSGGMDKIYGTWVKRWTLLDIFIVLIFTISLAKIFSKPLALVAFFTLILTYHEPGAPRYIWLGLLTGLTLLKYLPAGSFKKAVKVYQALAVAVFVLIAIPYAVNALRVGIYPQLERPWSSMNENVMRQRVSVAQPPVNKVSGAGYDSVSAPAKKMVRRAQSSLTGKNLIYSEEVMQYDPKALTQTGPGIPGWEPFGTFDFSWAGPVDRNQMISFLFTGPKVNLFLAFVRVFLVALLAFGMMGAGLRSVKKTFFSPNLAVVLLIISFSVFSPCKVQAGDIPTNQMLGELENRILAPDTCYPACADMAKAVITLSKDRLSMVLDVDAQIDLAIPLPGHVKQWLPRKVSMDNRPAQGVLRKQNKLWMFVPEGKHSIKLSGPVRRNNTFELSFPLMPHMVLFKMDDWSVDGVSPGGIIEGPLHFKRKVVQNKRYSEVLETGVLPPFVSVDREILLGLVWKVRTTVSRLSPAGSGIALTIPLIPGESVITENIRVTGDMANVNFQTNENAISWDSFLEQSNEILLEQKKTNQWTETWRVNVSPIFHLEYEGTPVILHKTGNRWYPTWHPWPGEEVKLKISRPAGIGGQTVTIENSHLELRPGPHATLGKLLLSISSSRGGQHTILLPAASKLLEVKIRGKVQPVRQEERAVSIPITPGVQRVELKWLEKGGIETLFRSPVVDLGIPGVNSGLDIYLPQNRWPLFVGGEQLSGPAVLFWSVIIIIVIIAFGLGKSGLTPLGFLQWFFLCLGMSMTHPAAGIIVAGWLVALSFRKKGGALEPKAFDQMQVGLVLLTIAALGALVVAISKGLLGHPDMNIVGNGSGKGLLRWYQDVSDPVLPRAWIFSVPMFLYRIAMLAWALWVSFWLVGIIRWGWNQFTFPQLWKPLPRRVKREKKDLKNKVGKS